MNKVCTIQISRILTEENIETKVSASMEFLRRQRREGDQFPDKTVTTDETMINLFDPDTKRESSVWKWTSSPTSLIARVSKSVKCVNLSSSWTREGCC